MKNILKNLSMSFMANFVTITVSLIITFILPKLMSVEQYGYWQVYLFYTTYVGILHFGLNDGIYLRYGGAEYSRLDFKIFNGQLKILSKLELIATLCFFVIAILFYKSAYQYIWIALGICTFFTNIRYMYIYILQATNRIKQFTIVTILDRVLFVFFILVFFIFRNKHYSAIIISDLLSRGLSMIFGMVFCKEIIMCHGEINSKVWIEIKKNIFSGSKLMFANLASSCIIGIVRYGIQKNWNVEIFGKVSLILSISNFFVIFINAVGIVFYPLLRRTNEEKRNELFFAIDRILDALLFSFLLFYFPVKIIITWWLPQYSSVMQYICLLFPIYIFEGRMALLYNTFLKVYRKESVIFLINIFCLFISFIYTLLSTFILNNLNFAVLGMMLLIALRCFINQIFCSKMLSVRYKNNIVCLFMGIIYFFWCGLAFNDGVGLVFLMFGIFVYELIGMKNTRKALEILKKHI